MARNKLPVAARKQEDMAIEHKVIFDLLKEDEINPAISQNIESLFREVATDRVNDPLLSPQFQRGLVMCLSYYESIFPDNAKFVVPTRESNILKTERADYWMTNEQMHSVFVKLWQFYEPENFKIMFDDYAMKQTKRLIRLYKTSAENFLDGKVGELKRPTGLAAIKEYASQLLGGKQIVGDKNPGNKEMGYKAVEVAETLRLIEDLEQEPVYMEGRGLSHDPEDSVRSRMADILDRISYQHNQKDNRKVFEHKGRANNELYVDATKVRDSLRKSTWEVHYNDIVTSGWTDTEPRRTRTQNFSRQLVELLGQNLVLQSGKYAGKEGAFFYIMPNFIKRNRK